MVDAKRHAERKKKYRTEQKRLRHEQADRAIADIRATHKVISGRKK